MLRRGGGDKFEVLTGGGAHDTKDTNMLSLVSRLYQLSGEAKVRFSGLTKISQHFIFCGKVFGAAFSKTDLFKYLFK